MSAILLVAVTTLLVMASGASASVGMGDTTIDSPQYSLSGLKGGISWPFNVRWRLVANAESAGGDLLSVRFYAKAGQYTAIGFSPFNMHGYITACYVPSDNTTAAVCTDVIGHDGGGVTKNPMQYSALQWARTDDPGFVACLVEIPLKYVNASYDMNNNTRLIFATSTWNSTTNMPEPHTADNKMWLHANLRTGAVAQESLPIATTASHTLQGTSNSQFWWFMVYNKTEASSYSNFNLIISDLTKWAGYGVAFPNGTRVGVTCYYGSPTPRCVDIYALPGGPVRAAPQQVSTIVFSELSKGKGYISVSTPLQYPRFTTMYETAIFAEGPWNVTRNMPEAPTEENFYVIRFATGGVSASRQVTPGVFPSHYNVSWSIFRQDTDYERYYMRVLISIKNGYFAGMGFANQSMGGPLVACHVPVNNAPGAMCRDFIGHVQGGVSVNPMQTTEVYGAAVDNGEFSSIDLGINLAAFNTSAQVAMNDPHSHQRMIFAYGHWDAQTNRPTYHGMHNATFFDINIFTGEIHGDPHPTAPPMIPKEKPRQADGNTRHRLNKFYL